MKLFALLAAAVLVALAAVAGRLWPRRGRTGRREQRRLPPAAPRESAFRTLLRMLVVGNRGCF